MLLRFVKLKIDTNEPGNNWLESSDISNRKEGRKEGRKEKKHRIIHT
jgi:hypothetical protein